MMGTGRVAKTRTGQERQGEEVVTGLTWKQSSAFRVEDLDDNKDERSATTTTAPNSAPSSHDVAIALNNPQSFSARQIASSDNNANRVVPRIESIQTGTGVWKRKIVGPFVLDNDDDDAANSCVEANGITRSLEDKGYSSFSHGSRKADSSNWGKVPGLDLHSSLCSSPTRLLRSMESSDRVLKKTSVDEMELYQRRRQSEDKCAEVSRRMREEALAKREAERKEIEKTALSPDFFEKDLRSPSKCGKKRNRCENEDDIFANDHLSSEDIEAQLDIAQSFVNNHGNLPSPKDMSRSCQPPTFAIGMGKADHPAESDLPSNELNRPSPISIPHPEKQLLNGRVTGTTTSGARHYDQEQAERHWRKINKQERRKETWPAKREIERLQGSNVPSPKVIDGARGKDEARLLAAKEPLRAAPNVNGVLAQLGKKVARRDRGASKAGEPQDGQHAISTFQTRCKDQRVDEGFWTKEGNLRQRKRDIENLMAAFMETAKCWCVAFEALSEHYRTPAVRELQELKEFAHPILQGYSFRNKAEKRITHIKSNMARRIQKHFTLNRSFSDPSQHDIDRTLVGLIGQERLRQGKELLRKVRMENEEHKVNAKKKRHLKRSSSKPDSSGATGLITTTLANGLHEKGEGTESESGEQNLTSKQQAGNRKFEAKCPQIKQAIARSDEVDKPAQQDESKKVRFADQCLWDNGFDHMQSSESEVSDEDEDETAPSIGRGNDSGSMTQTHINPVRKDVGGKGLLSQLRRVDEKMTTSRPITGDRPTVRKRLPSQSGNVPPIEERDSPVFGTRREVGAKSLPIIQQREALKALSITTEPADNEESLDEADELESEAEESLPDDETDDIDEHDDTKILQYQIIIDYENFGDLEDANSVSLGRYIDADAALRQMATVGADISAWAAREYRYTRTSWDTDDFELATHTTILPTGGECRVRMVKSWAPAPEWPGKHRAAALARPKVFYLVHETKTTSLRPPGDVEGEGEAADLFGPDDYQDTQAVVERERDWCFTSRRHANEVARDRLTAFSNRHGGAMEGIGGTTSAAELAEYIEQIEHDKVCFEQEKRVWIETAEARKGKVEIRIWVEELIADLPHV
jgi:hypothetical protein